MSTDATTAPRLARAGRLFVTAACAAGAAVVVQAAVVDLPRAASFDWLLFSLLILGTNAITIRVPALPARLSVSEAFIFASAMLFGPGLTAITLALDGFVFSFRRSRSVQRSLFNASVLALSIFTGGHLWLRMSGGLVALDALDVERLILPLAALTTGHFIVNSSLIASAVAFETGSRAFAVWRQHFLWVSVNYVAGASGALILLLAMRHVSLVAVAVILPVLAVCYVALRSSFGRIDDNTRHVQEVDRLYLRAVETLATAIDAKDDVTHGHIRRVQTLARSLARTLGVKDELTLKAIDAAALLHDTGKLAVPEYILNKPGALTPAEFDEMKKHTTVGAQIVGAIGFPYPVVPIVRHHHENWNGSGYPDGLRGEEIPIGARILSVVDCYDALTSDRPYRARLPEAEALAIIKDRRGTMYDPRVVDTFMEVCERDAGHDVRVPVPAFAAEIRSASRPPSAPDPSLPAIDRLGGDPALAAICALPRTIGAHGSLHDVMALCWPLVRQLIPCTGAVLYAPLPDRCGIGLRSVAGDASPGLVGTRVPFGSGVSGWVAAHRRPFRGPSALPELGDGARLLPAAPRVCLSVPLTDGASLAGVLTLYSDRSDALTETDARIVQLVAPHLASALLPALKQASSDESDVRRSHLRAV